MKTSEILLLLLDLQSLSDLYDLKRLDPRSLQMKLHYVESRGKPAGNQ